MTRVTQYKCDTPVAILTQHFKICSYSCISLNLQSTQYQPYSLCALFQMTSFIIALAVLIGGYFIYGLIVDRIMDTDAGRPMPAITRRDNVDFMPMPAWKHFLYNFST